MALEADGMPFLAENPGDDRSALDHAYADAMGAVVAEYPDDLDAAAVYAEALMDV